MKTISFVSLLISIGFVVMVIYLIRKRHLKEQYSLLWLLFGLCMIVLSVRASWLEAMADMLDVEYAPALLFLVGIIFCLLIILHLTVVVSKLVDRVVRLTQEVGILRNETEKRKGE